MRKIIKVEGMSCTHCVKHVKEALEQLSGVSAEVSLERKEAVVSGDSLDDAALKAAVAEAGYQAISIA